MRIRLAIALAGAALLLVLPSSAGAVGVAYIQDHEVWVSTLDGATKVRLSAGEGQWIDVAQGDGGQVIGVRNEPGKNGQYGIFQVWQPNGTVSDQGPMNVEQGWQIYVQPLSLDITPDASFMVYGFSNSRYISMYEFSQGTYVQPVNTRTLMPPFAISGQKWPTLFGARIVSADSDTTNAIQDPTQQSPPYSNVFTPWLSLGGGTYKIHRTDVAATGKVAAVEFYEPNPGSGDNLQERIAMFPIDAPGGAVNPVDHDCFLPAVGKAKTASLSQDGKQIAYVDDGGLKIAPVTDFAALVTDCAPTAPVVTISPTGTHPSIGPINVPALVPAAPAPPPPPPPPPPAAGGPSSSGPALATVPAGAKASALAAGLRVGVTVPAAGKATVTLLVSSKTLGLKGRARSVVIARGSATARAAGKLTVKLKATKAAKRKLKRLKGKKLTLRLLFAGKTTNRTITLK